MYLHHKESIEKLKEYFIGQEGVAAIVLDGSVVKGNARPDSDIDAVIVVTEERFARLSAEGKFAEVIAGYCTYEGGYFDIKYKTKAFLQEAAIRASEPTRNAFVNAQTVYSTDPKKNCPKRCAVSMRIYSLTAVIFCIACKRKTRICARIWRRRSFTAYTA